MKLLHLLAPIALAALLAGCATPAQQRAPYVPTTLSATDRQAAFDQVWKTINEDYVDGRHNGVDWKSVGERYRPRVLATKDDEAFWRELNLMVGEMRDAHTLVRSPLEVNGKATQRGWHGLTLARVDGQLIVKSVASNSQAQLLGVRAGMKLAQIDGEAAEAWWQRTAGEVRGSSTEKSNFALVQQTLNARPVDSLLRLRFERGAAPLELTLRQDPLQPFGVRAHWLDSGLGYLRFGGFNTGFEQGLETSLVRLAGAKGLVLDLRENGGGSLKLTMQLLGWLLPPGKAGEVFTRDNRRLSALFGLLDVTPTLEIKPQEKRLTLPLAVLIDERSASAAELMAGVLQDQGRARVFGEASCGCLLMVRGAGQSLPGGGRLVFSEADLRIGKDKRIEGLGVQPDEPVPPATAALLAGRDLALEAAQAWLLKQAASAPGTTTSATTSATINTTTESKAGKP